MTNEERQQAIEWLKRRPVMMAGAKRMYDLAIEALEAYFPDTNAGDMISRQAAKLALCKAVHKDKPIPCDNQTASCLWSRTRVCDYAREIDALPPVQPKRGKWLPDNNSYYEIRFVCSQCKTSERVPTMMYEPLWDFCPHCGADMRCSENPNS